MLEKEFQSILDPSDPLLYWRQKAWNRFCEIGWPKEAFQYIPLKGLEIPGSAEPDAAKGIEDAIVFVNGFFASPHSFCIPIEEAMRTYGVFLQNRMTKTLKEEKDPLALLGFAFQGGGAFLYIPPNGNQSFTVEHISTSDQMASSYLVVYVGKNGRLKLDQCARTARFCNIVIDIVLDQGAEIFLHDAPDSDAKATLFQSLRASLKRDSKWVSRFYSEGADLSRTSIRVQLLEENSEALLQGLWRLGGTRQHHVHALVEHGAPHTRSRQHFKGVLKERSRSSFEGKIYVHPMAQKTEAYQINNNLLLSDESAAFAKPNLEIFADDVKASHGATVAQLNEDDLFYLRSRGIPLQEAQDSLAEGFCRELIECIPEKKR